jgi:cardiolipin synthase
LFPADLRRLCADLRNQREIFVCSYKPNIDPLRDQFYYINRKKYTTNSVTFLRSGEEYFSALETLISSAQKSIHIQVYIFDEDETGKRIIELLRQALKRDIAIYIVIDGYASEKFSKTTAVALIKEGMFIKRFSNIFSNKGFRMGRRLHHKIVLVDDAIALIGGINIANKYKGINGEKAWLDFAIQVQGEICNEIRDVCIAIWNKRFRRKHKLLHFKRIVTQGYTVLSRISVNDWLRRRMQITYSYRDAVRGAQESVIIVASYFLPGSRMRKLIKDTTAKGVKVTIILGGISDVPFVKPAIHYLYKWLFKNNVVIYEWKPSVLHGKLIIVDNHWASIGSYNINALSDYGSLEMNVEIKDDAFAIDTTKRIQQIIAEGCVEINGEHFLKRNMFFINAWRWLCYLLLRSLLRLLFLFMTNKKNRHYS